MFARHGRLLFGFEQHIAQPLDIFLTVRDGLIHIRNGFVTQAGSHLGDIGFGIIDLPVLEFPVDNLLTFRRLFVLDFFERLTNLTLGFGGRDEVQPIGIRVLVRRGQNRHLISVLEFLSNGHILITNSTSDTVRTYFAMNRIRKIKHRSALRKTSQISRWGEDIDVSFFLYDGAFDTFVGPVSSHSLLRYFIHSFGTNLHLYPSLIGTQDRSMKRLITVLFGNGEPVAQTLGIGSEDIGNEGIDLPAIGLLSLQRGIEDDADRKEIINLIDITMLRLHLMIDGVNRFRTSFDGKFEACIREFFLQRGYEPRDILFPLGFLCVQRVRDILIGIVFEELEREVLHLGFNLI